MKKNIKVGLLIPFALALTAGSVLADEEDSTLKKAAKIKVYQEADDDSTLKKAAGLKATGEILQDEDDSTLKKATKMKVLKEAGEEGK